MKILDRNSTVYLAGPMRGLPFFNFPAFREASAWLREQGMTVYDPAAKDIEDGWDPVAMRLTGNEDMDEYNFDLKAALTWDTEHVLKADALVVLHGFRDSKGAIAEVALAAAAGIPIWIYCACDQPPVLIPAEHVEVQLR